MLLFPSTFNCNCKNIYLPFTSIYTYHLQVYIDTIIIEKNLFDINRWIGAPILCSEYFEISWDHSLLYICWLLKLLLFNIWGKFLMKMNRKIYKWHNEIKRMLLIKKASPEVTSVTNINQINDFYKLCDTTTHIMQKSNHEVSWYNSLINFFCLNYLFYKQKKK